MDFTPLKPLLQYKYLAQVQTKLTLNIFKVTTLYHINGVETR